MAMNGNGGLPPMNGASYAAYGATPYYGDYQGAPMKSPFVRGGRNFSVAILGASLILPWLIFAIVYSFESMSIHYTYPQLVLVVIVVLALACAGLCLLAFNAWRKRHEGADSSWYVFMAITAILALTLGVVLGQKNFEANMVPYEDISNLNVYSGIDPHEYTGQQLMDAGRIGFVNNAQLNLKLSMGFKNLKTFCVAPVVVNSTKPEVEKTYDFWAVGLNCCEGHRADFHCGEFNNPLAKSGVRLMNEDYQNFYRLAVQQAEAAYNIHANHPVFLYWMQEPLAEVDAYQEDAYKFYLLGMLCYAGFQLILVVLALLIIPKTGY